MHSITCRNLNGGYNDGLWWLKTAGEREQTRGGLVMASPTPVCTTIQFPWQRFLFDPMRRANPFFHLAEALWVMSGSNDIRWLSQFNKNVTEFSDDGRTWRGAYGHRWANHFAVDQVRDVIEMLRKDPTTRRAVLSMWDPRMDLAANSKDIPCNTHIYFRYAHGALDMTVCCRSNDLVWGAMGSNAFVFGFVHELISRACGLDQGFLRQFSNNYHLYERHFPLMTNARTAPDDPYPDGYTGAALLETSGEIEDFIEDCQRIVGMGQSAGVGEEGLKTFFVREVAQPFLRMYLTKNYDFKALPFDYRWAAEYWVNDISKGAKIAS